MTTSETITFSSFYLQQLIKLFWLYQLNFRKAVFSFSPSISILKQCEVDETIYASSSYLTVEYIRERQCYVYQLLSAIQTQPHLPASSQTSPIYLAQVPLSPEDKEEKEKKKKKITTIRLKRQFWFHSN